MSKQAEKLRQLADGMTATIDAKRSPAVAQQRMTRRRVEMADAMAREGDRLARIQRALTSLADAHLAGTVPPSLASLKNKAQVESLLAGYFNDDTQARLGVTSREQLDAMKADLLALTGKDPVASPVSVQIARAERELLGCKIPGYFPTPPKLVAEMIRRAELQSHHRVLEPSAGKGDIAMAIRAAGVEPTCVEIQQSLVRILVLKEFEVMGVDFLALGSGVLVTGTGGGYDRIIMNPPFERFQDVEHVMHAYRWLAPGGRVVAIMGESAFFRQDQKAVDFRAWLDEVGGTSEKNEAGAFNASDRQTGVATRLVVINR